MGADLYTWVEYDAFGNPPFGTTGVDWECIPFDKWINLVNNKDYKFIGAISGLRNQTGISPLISLRGCPLNPGHQFRRHLGDFGDNVGWLLPHEVHAAIQHHGLRLSDLSLEVEALVTLLDFLEKRIGNDRVRLIFDIHG